MERGIKKLSSSQVYPGFFEVWYSVDIRLPQTTLRHFGIELSEEADARILPSRLDRGGAPKLCI